MGTALDAVRSLRDVEIARVMERLYGSVFSAVPYDDLVRASEESPEVGGLVGLGRETLARELSPEDSARLGRSVLLAYAQDPALAPVVQQAVDEVRKSDELVIGVLLTAALVVNLTLLVATTRVEIERDENGKTRWKIVKKEASKELLEAVVKPVTSALSPGS
jgi:hypothetical protein